MNMFCVNHICNRLQRAKQSICNPLAASELPSELQTGPSTAGFESLLVKAGRVRQLHDWEDAHNTLSQEDYTLLLLLSGHPQTGDAAKAGGTDAGNTSEAATTGAAGAAGAPAAAALPAPAGEVPMKDLRVKQLLAQAEDVRVQQVVVETVLMHHGGRLSSIGEWRRLVEKAGEELSAVRCVHKPFTRLLPRLLPGRYELMTHRIDWPVVHNDGFCEGLVELLKNPSEVAEKHHVDESQASRFMRLAPPTVHVPSYNALLDLLFTLARFNTSQKKSQKDPCLAVLLLPKPAGELALTTPQGNAVPAFPGKGISMEVLQPLPLHCLDESGSTWSPTGKPGVEALQGQQLLDRHEFRRQLTLPPLHNEAGLMRALSVAQAVRGVVEQWHGYARRVYLTPLLAESTPASAKHQQRQLKEKGKQQQQQQQQHQLQDLKLAIMPERMADYEILRIHALNAIMRRSPVLPV